MRTVMLALAMAGTMALPALAETPGASESASAVEAMTKGCFPFVASPTQRATQSPPSYGPVTLILSVGDDRAVCTFKVDTTNEDVVHAALTKALLARPEGFKAAATPRAVGVHVSVDFFCAVVDGWQYWVGVGKTLPNDPENLALFLVSRQTTRDARCDDPGAQAT